MDVVRARTTGPANSLPEATDPATPAQTPPVAGLPDEPQRVRPHQAIDVTIGNITESVRFNAVLIVGALLYPLVVTRRRRPPTPGTFSEPGFAAFALLAWTGMIGAAYLFWAVRRGFFQAYFLEIAPPLTVLAAAAAVYSAREIVRNVSRVRLGLALALLVAALLAIPGALGILPLDRPLYFVVPTATLAVVHLLDRAAYRRWLLALLGVALLSIAVFSARAWLPGVLDLGLYALLVAGVLALVFWAARVSHASAPGMRTSFASYALIVSALFLTLGESIPVANLRYDGVWGPGAVRAVADEVRRLTNPGDEVMSGAVVWELEAGRRPFMRISHPLGLMNELVGEAAPPIARRLEENPPPVVVLDAYTERTYLAAVPELRALLDTRYTRTLTVEADTRPRIEVYRLNE
jgi:hypothetical protein